MRLSSEGEQSGNVAADGADGGAARAGLGCVILAHGSGSDASALARQLLDQDMAPSSIALVRNPAGGADPPLELPAESIRVIHMPHNRGYAGGMNAGLRLQLERGAEKVLLLTQDVRLRPGAVEALLRAAERDPSFGALGPVLLDQRTGKPFSYGVKPLPGGGLAHRRTPPPARDAIAPSASIDGAVMLLRADALRAVGPLEERFFMYFEEADLCLRIARAGWGVGVAMDAIAEQESGATRRPRAFGYLVARNGLEYARRAAGARGIAATLARQLAVTLFTLQPTLRSLGREPLTGHQRDQLVGTWAGTLAFALRRFGPPPPSFSDDITGLASDEWS
jgi:GT2 family glycosyltransferase